MDIQHIETSDCTILNTEMLPNELRICFESIYDLEKKQYTSNICLSVFNWSFFEARLFIANGLEPKKLAKHELEFFEYCQKISIEGNSLILQGFSRESGYWLEYRFVDSDYCLN